MCPRAVRPLEEQAPRLSRAAEAEEGAPGRCWGWRPSQRFGSEEEEASASSGAAEEKGAPAGRYCDAARLMGPAAKAGALR